MGLIRHKSCLMKLRSLFNKRNNRRKISKEQKEVQLPKPVIVKVHKDRKQQKPSKLNILFSLGSIKLTLVLIFALLGVLGFHFFVSNARFDISEVVVNGTNKFVSTSEVKTLVGNRVTGKNIILLDSKSLEGIVMETFQGAKNVGIRKHYPNKIIVEIIERTPKALVENSEEAFLVDEEGYVLGVQDKSATNLPTISYSGDVRVGYFVDEKVIPAYLEVLKSADEVGMNVSSVSIKHDDVEVYAQDSLKLLIRLDSVFLNEFYTAKSIVLDSETKGKKVSIVDLRFDKVIVSFK